MCRPVTGITGESLSGKREARFGRHLIECYDWHISTKYYDADVHFLLLPERDLVSESFSQAVEAAVFHMSVDREGFTAMQTWMPFVNEFQPEIRILACDNAPEEGQVPRLEIQNWCIENGFEFVELAPDEEEVDDDVEDDFKESNSYLRIRQALHAHSWPILSLKGLLILLFIPLTHVLSITECPEYTPSPKFRDILTPATAESVSPAPESSTSERVTSLVDESEKIFQDLHVDDETNGDFENLFEKFQEMRGKQHPAPTRVCIPILFSCSL